MLREQLAQANDSNAALSDDLKHVTEDWNQIREELKRKETEWKEEQEVRRSLA